MDGRQQRIAGIEGFRVVDRDGCVGYVERVLAGPGPPRAVVRVGLFESRTFEVPLDDVTTVDFARRRVFLGSAVAEHALGDGAPRPRRQGRCSVTRDDGFEALLYPGTGLAIERRAFEETEAIR
jgi:hypothetical protein